MLRLNELFKVLSEKAIFFFFPNLDILLIKTESNKDAAPPIPLQYYDIPLLKILIPLPTYCMPETTVATAVPQIKISIRKGTWKAAYLERRVKTTVPN